MKESLNRSENIMHDLREYDLVRIVKLEYLNRPYEGTETVMRPPKVGDVATICHEYDPENAKSKVAVEMVDSHGNTVWLADFDRCELELVKRP